MIKAETYAECGLHMYSLYSLVVNLFCILHLDEEKQKSSWICSICLSSMKVTGREHVVKLSNTWQLQGEANAEVPQSAWCAHMCSHSQWSHFSGSDLFDLFVCLHRLTSTYIASQCFSHLESFRRLHPLHSESHSWKATSRNCDVEQWRRCQVRCLLHWKALCWSCKAVGAELAPHQHGRSNILEGNRHLKSSDCEW